MTSTSKLPPPITGTNLPEFGPAPQPSSKRIVIANEYGSVHTKGWIVPKKKEPLHVERQAKGHCRIKMGRDGFKRQKPVEMEFDSPEEMLKAMWEDTDAKLAGYRFPDQKSFKNRQKQLGKGLWSNRLVSMVLKLNPLLFVEDSWGAPGCAAFYRMVDGEKQPTNASFRKGFVPEFTIIKSDRADLPIEFTYGWRTVLMRLVKVKALTLAQINSVWGDVKYGDERAKHYDAYMREWKT